MSIKECSDPPPFLRDECFQGKVVEGLSYTHVFAALEWLSSKTSLIGSGGVSVFLGFVKSVVDNARVIKLKYTSYEPYASKTLDNIAKSYSNNPNIYGIIILHTSGDARPGSPTLFVAISGKTRKDSLEVTREVVERVKKEPPIFKLEIREDGEYWILGDGRRVKRLTG
jgi:molybdopterin synthase catalytic subunit